MRKRTLAWLVAVVGNGDLPGGGLNDVSGSTVSSGAPATCPETQTPNSITAHERNEGVLRARPPGLQPGLRMTKGPAMNTKLALIFCAVLLSAGITMAAPRAASPGASVAGAGSAAASVATSAGAFCSKLQPLLQPLVKVALVLHRADDAASDPMHQGESQYVDCDFRQAGTQIDLSLHDDSSGLFDDAGQQGYAPLPGFGEKARYSVRGAMGMRWADVVRRKTACEARLTMQDVQITGDWKQVAGKMCDAAFALR